MINSKLWVVSFFDVYFIFSGMVAHCFGNLMAGEPLSRWLSVGGMLADTPQTYW